MNGPANVTCAEVDTTTRKNASTHANIATFVVAIEALIVAEEGGRIGTTTRGTKTGTEIRKTRTKDSGDQKARRKHHTKDHLTDKELLENHSESK